MLDFSIYLFYRAGTAIVSILPLRVLFRVGEFFGICGWVLMPGYRRLASENLRIAFGTEQSGGDLRRLARRHFRRLGANLLCSVKLTSMPVEKILRRIDVENVEAVNREFRAGAPVVLVLSHLSTWELFAQLMPKLVDPVQASSVYQKLGNRFIDAHVHRTRSRTGLRLFDRKEGFQPVIELLRTGGGVGILSDQHAGDHGVWTPFFGKLASTSPLPALLAKRSRAALIAAAVYTVAPARWRMIFTERIDTADASVEILTEKTNAIIEQQIRRAPEDWFWVHNRWKTPRPNFLLTEYKRGIHLPPDISASDLKSFRILIRSSNWLGDAIMSVPAVRAIKRGRPDAHVTVAAPAKIAPVWKLVSEADEVINLNRSLFAAVRKIRQQSDFDAAILFPNSLRAALEVWLGGVSRRVGYAGHWRRWLLNQIVRDRERPGPIEHQSTRFLRIAQDCGATLTEEIEEVGRDRRARRVKDIVVQTAAGSASPPSQLLGLCPGAEYGPAKRWLPDRFAEVATEIAERAKIQWVLFGTKNEAAIGNQIASALNGDCLNRVGQTTLEQLIDELRDCRLLLTNDTGTMHLASLLGVPAVAIFASTEPRLTGPLGDGHIVLRHQVECSPCFLRECPIDFRCMKSISVVEVVEAVMSILSKEDRTMKKTGV